MRLRVSAVLNKIELELDRFFFFFERCLDLESKKTRDSLPTTLLEVTGTLRVRF